MGRTLLAADRLGVRYDLASRRRSGLRGRLLGGRRDGGVWALHDVSFELAEGEALAIIGRNGAGKSTLLRVLAGILPPTTGELRVDGRVSALLSLQAGFIGTLTGRENIRLAGALLGAEPRRWRSREAEIVEFSELGEAIDRPFETYSNGMRARLAFSTISALEPDILLIDEVLAAGDEGFRQKSRARLIELAGQARGLIIVSHGLGGLTGLATRALLLDGGRVAQDGQLATVVASYRSMVAAAAEDVPARTRDGLDAGARRPTVGESCPDFSAAPARRGATR
jgi:lipopolysaccharide transport system ATP-binding protein